MYLMACFMTTRLGSKNLGRFFHIHVPTCTCTRIHLCIYVLLLNLKGFSVYNKVKMYTYTNSMYSQCRPMTAHSLQSQTWFHILDLLVSE